MERSRDTSMRQVKSLYRILVSHRKQKYSQKAGIDLRPYKEELIESLWEEQQS